MLRKKEKQTLTRLFLLVVGSPIGLDHFYEENVTGGLIAILCFLAALITMVRLFVWILLVGFVYHTKLTCTNENQDISL